MGQWQVVFITWEQLRNSYSAASTFICWGSTAVVLEILYFPAFKVITELRIFAFGLFSALDTVEVASNYYSYSA